MASQPQRIRLSRKKGYRKPEGAIVVARPSKWGNPYRVVPRKGGGFHVYDGPEWIGPYWYETKIEAAQRAVKGFTIYFLGGGSLFGLHLAELKGHDLACWCPLDAPCHADVLLEWANKYG